MRSGTFSFTARATSSIRFCCFESRLSGFFFTSCSKMPSSVNSVTSATRMQFTTVIETYGLTKQGGKHSTYLHTRGYHPRLAVIAESGEVVHSRLREGRAAAGRGPRPRHHRHKQPRWSRPGLVEWRGTHQKPSRQARPDPRGVQSPETAMSRGGEALRNAARPRGSEVSQ